MPTGGGNHVTPMRCQAYISFDLILTWCHDDTILLGQATKQKQGVCYEANSNDFDTNEVLKYYVINHMYRASTCSSPYQPYLNTSNTPPQHH